MSPSRQHKDANIASSSKIRKPMVSRSSLSPDKGDFPAANSSNGVPGSKYNKSQTHYQDENTNPDEEEANGLKTSSVDSVGKCGNKNVAKDPETKKASSFVARLKQDHDERESRRRLLLEAEGEILRQEAVLAEQKRKIMQEAAAQERAILLEERRIKLENDRQERWNKIQQLKIEEKERVKRLKKTGRKLKWRNRMSIPIFTLIIHLKSNESTLCISRLSFFLYDTPRGGASLQENGGDLQNLGGG